LRADGDLWLGLEGAVAAAAFLWLSVRWFLWAVRVHLE
jgi:hypothetical protein